MSVKVITNFNYLMKKAHTVGKAKMENNPEKLKKAKKRT